jgi:hypothetical protein
MKRLTFLILISFICRIGYTQTKNEIIIGYGFAKNDIIMNDDIIGDMGFTGKKTIAFGVDYLRSLNNYFVFETGFTYSDSKITYNYFPSGILNTKEEEIKLLSIPCGVSLNLLKYFFINAGTTLDIESGRTSDQNTHDQSGLGFYGGFGAKYSIHNFSIRINPFILEHAVIPFKKDSYKQKLWENGMKIGIGYVF